METTKIRNFLKNIVLKYFLINYVILQFHCNNQLPVNTSYTYKNELNGTDKIKNTSVEKKYDFKKYEKFNLTPTEFSFSHDKFSKNFTFMYYFLNSEYYDYIITKNSTKISEISDMQQLQQLNKLELTNSYSNNDYYLAVKKNHLNYSLNDAFFFDFGQHQKILNPKHLQFGFYIGEVKDPDNFEGCNLRLTNFTLESLLNNSLRTNYSDPLLFRIRNNQSISINDQSYFLNFTSYNYNSPIGFSLVDLFFNWETNSILFLHNKNMLDMNTGEDNLFTSFFHINLMQNYTKPSKVLFYNLQPNTSCYLKNLVLCEDFCDEESRMLYMNYTNDGKGLARVRLTGVKLLGLFLFIFLILL